MVAVAMSDTVGSTRQWRGSGGVSRKGTADHRDTHDTCTLGPARMSSPMKSFLTTLSKLSYLSPSLSTSVFQFPFIKMKGNNNYTSFGVAVRVKRIRWAIVYKHDTRYLINVSFHQYYHYHYFCLITISS